MVREPLNRLRDTSLLTQHACFFAVIVFVLVHMIFAAPASAALTEFFSDTGKLFVSVDGGGSIGSSDHVIEVQKPNADATVQRAFVLAASTGNRNRAIGNDEVTIQSRGIDWDVEVPGAFRNFNHRADVTSIVQPTIDQAPPGRIRFLFGESPTLEIDGEILVVIFDDPTQDQDSTVVLLDGQQTVSGDLFAITLAEPINPSTPPAFFDMGLGISYSLQADNAFSDQDSLIDVNGTTLTSSAGGEDDGEPSNGALITVGGLDDSIGNPRDPNVGSNDNPRFDDELYSLLPIIMNTATQSINVNTRNPSNDDNIFFAYFNIATPAVVGSGVLLTPMEATNQTGTNHTITALVVDDSGAPVPSTLVMFSVVSGPNDGESGTDVTDGMGEATFTYAGNGGEGTDIIQASFIDSQQETVTSNNVSKTWTSPPTASLSIDFTGSGGGRTDADLQQIGGGVICFSTQDCTLSYFLEQPPVSVTLTATPVETNGQLSIFAGWSGCNSAVGNQCTVVMNSDQAVAVRFIAPVTVPDVSGQPQSTATAALQASPFTFTVTPTPEASATVTSGNVIRTEPPANTSVAPGSPVNLFISSGVPLVVIPDVSGQPQSTATAALQASPFAFTVTPTPEASATVASGNVIRTEPPANTSVAPGSPVNLFISSGVPLVVIPDVSGQPQSTATAALQASPFAFTVTPTPEASATVASGNVIRTEPPANTSVAPGSPVNLFISSGVPLVVIPDVSGQPQSTATAALQASPFAFTVTPNPEASATVASGNVIRTEPPANTSVVPGSPVNLFISSGSPTGVNDFNDGADADPTDGICETGTGNGVCTLRAAIQEANAQQGEQTITLTPGTYNVNLSGSNEDNASAGDLDITDNLIITSSTGDSTTVIISGNGLDRVFDLPQGSPNVTIRGVTIQGGNIIGSTGGGIRNVAGTLTVENSVVTNNQSQGSGGGISHLSGALVVQGTTVSNNTSQGLGGGVQAQSGTVTIEANSQFTGNQANFGGGLSIGSANVIVTNSTMTSNTATGGGGGIYNFLHPGDLIPGITTPTVRLEETTLQGNLTNDCEGFLINGSNNTIGNIDRCNLQAP